MNRAVPMTPSVKVPPFAGTMTETPALTLARSAKDAMPSAAVNVYKSSRSAGEKVERRPSSDERNLILRGLERVDVISAGVSSVDDSIESMSDTSDYIS